MWRDPYRRGVGEQLVSGLLTLLAMVFVAELVLQLLLPLVPLLIAALVVVILASWWWAGRYY